MLGLIKAATQLQKLFDQRKWRYCFIGGLAVQKWGQVRVTDDVDLALFTGLGKEKRFIDEILQHYNPRIPQSAEFAIRSRVLLLKDKQGVEIDISLAGFPFEERAITRAKKVSILKGIRLRLCTAEDLIVYKAFANRPIDWMDVEGIIAKQFNRNLDWKYILAQIELLAQLKEEPEIVPKLKALRAEVR